MSERVRRMEAATRNERQHAPRELLRAELRKLRLERKLTGTELAKKAGVSQSKISKIETGSVIPSGEDVRRISAVLGASKTRVSRLLEQVRIIHTEFRPWQFEAGLVRKQLDAAELERRASRIRVFEMTVVPGPLQIPPYARCLMTFSGMKERQAIEEAVAARMSRQSLLYDSGRQFEFLLTEQAALSRFCDRDIVLSQLDRLRGFLDLPNIRLGVLPAGSTLHAIPLNSFSLFDQGLATIETFTGEISVFEEQDVAAYNEAFDNFAASALFGTAAIQYIEDLKNLIRKELACADEIGGGTSHA